MIPDPIELGEARMERWAAENLLVDTVRGETLARCACGEWYPLSEAETLSSDPYAIPVCPRCFEAWWEERA